MLGKGCSHPRNTEQGSVNFHHTAGKTSQCKIYELRPDPVAEVFNEATQETETKIASSSQP